MAAALHLGPRPGGERQHRCVARAARRHRQPVGDAAGRLHQPGGRQVGQVQQHARGEAHEAGAAVGFDDDQPRDAQAGVAQQQRVADLQVQRAQQGRIDPHRAGRRRLRQGLVGRAWPGVHQQPAAQRVAVAHRLDADQPGRAALGVRGPAHAREAGRGGGREAELGGLGDEAGRRRLVARDDRVAAQHLPGVARQAVLDPVGEEADRGQRRHRQRHRDEQQPQLAGPEVAGGLAPGKRPDRGGEAGGGGGQGIHGPEVTGRGRFRTKAGVCVSILHAARPFRTTREPGPTDRPGDGRYTSKPCSRTARPPCPPRLPCDPFSPPSAC